MMLSKPSLRQTERLSSLSLLLLTLFYLGLTVDEFPNDGVGPTMCVLPLLFWTAQSWFPAFRSDPELLTPKNVMLFIFLNKLVLIPFEIIIWGNLAPKFEPLKSPMQTEVGVVGLAFFAFVMGWAYRARQKPGSPDPAQPGNGRGRLAWGYLGIGVWAVLFQYGSLTGYFSRAILKESAETFNLEAGGSLLGLLANLGARFLPFAVMLFWLNDKRDEPPSCPRNLVFTGLCLLASLHSNRANILYPVLTFAGVAFGAWRVRHKLLVLLLAVPAIVLVFFFGLVRSLREFAWSEVPGLIRLFIENISYVPMAHQVYFGTPYQITPLLRVNADFYGPTLLSSFLFPVPVLGKSFRDTSGVMVYNGEIYGTVIHPDQVIPVSGEFYYNGGFPAVFLSHLAIGYAYCFLDQRFKQNLGANQASAFAWFYLALLFNATIFLSLSVLVQFLIYSAAPALLLLLINRFYSPLAAARS
ncbi:hypothetical protein [Tellurirhabdus rosea]|uniref:hypothetical protein n=1 Tax=Tellurirhabdus rosea TaxID=2674997 RepID=UPI00225A3751|nr:hypothetical protein [Tellurirhabdus rosea]